MVPLAFLFGCILISAPLIAAADAPLKCYFPNGHQTPDRWSVCGDGSGDSHCCDQGHLCLSNALCFKPESGNVYRGACTDKTWKVSESKCARNCNNIFSNSAVALLECPPSHDGDWRWWCGNDYKNVCGAQRNGSEIFESPFKVDTGKVVASIRIGTNITTSNSTMGNATFVTSTSPRNDPDLKPKSYVSPGIIIGVGVGLSAALLAVSTLLGGLLIRERNIRKKLEVNMAFKGAAQYMAAKDSCTDSPLPKTPAPHELADNQTAELEGGISSFIVEKYPTRTSPYSSLDHDLDHRPLAPPVLPGR